MWTLPTCKHQKVGGLLLPVIGCALACVLLLSAVLHVYFTGGVAEVEDVAASRLGGKDGPTGERETLLL
jgi:hypothetical protein